MVAAQISVEVIKVGSKAKVVYEADIGSNTEVCSEVEVIIDIEDCSNKEVNNEVNAVISQRSVMRQRSVVTESHIKVAGRTLDDEGFKVLNT